MYIQLQGTLEGIVNLQTIIVIIKLLLFLFLFFYLLLLLYYYVIISIIKQLLLFSRGPGRLEIFQGAGPHRPPVPTSLSWILGEGQQGEGEEG